MADCDSGECLALGLYLLRVNIYLDDYAVVMKFKAKAIVAQVWITDLYITRSDVFSIRDSSC